MTREIRITIADDEVFERMKQRKRDLDLSWEDVVHRGLRVAPVQEGRPRDEKYSAESNRYTTRDPVRDPHGFTADLKSNIQTQVRQSLAESLGSPPFGPSETDPLDSTVDSLEAAEDAILSFGCLGEHATNTAFQVPLRVVLEADSTGLSIEVIAIRGGKSTEGMNEFGATSRRTIVEHLATGGTADLTIGTDDESYHVSPVLTWERFHDVPRVSDVQIEEVHFDNDAH